MRLYSIRFGFLFAFACFISLTWITSNPYHEVQTIELNLQTLYERLMVAEELGGQVRKDLSSILEGLRNISKAANNTHHTTNNIINHNNNNNSNDSYNNRTPKATEAPRRPSNASGEQAILQPTIYLYMPHLRHHPESLVPNIVLGQGRRGVSVVIGVPTVKREKETYLINTLSSLLSNLTPSEKKDILIIIFVAETDSKYVSSIADIIRLNFPADLQSGLLEVVSPPQYYYPDFSSLKETFGDSKERVKWRTKQNLDFSFLMLYAQDKGKYYVQLEDDVIAKMDYFSQMKTFADEGASEDWLYLEFSQLGFIGKLFRTRDLPMIAEFFLMFHRDKPIDWLLDHILWVKVCNPEKDAKHCNDQKASLKQRFKPSLFQHVGLHSSLSGKIQNLKDKDFGGKTLFKAHRNPPAVLSSSLKQYKTHSLEKAYQGQDFFWALAPVKNDYILFNFSRPINITGFLFRSGNVEHSGDKFFNTTVEVLPSNAPAPVKPVNGSSSSDTGFVMTGEFVNGVAEGKIAEALQPVSALRLVVHANTGVWVLLNEIHIKV